MALYEFDEGAGTLIRDTSGFGSPLNLYIAQESRTRWLPGALSIDSATILSSSAGAGKITDEVSNSGEIMIETWIKPHLATQEGPARIVTLSANTTSRNVTLA